MGPADSRAVIWGRAGKPCRHSEMEAKLLIGRGAESCRQYPEADRYRRENCVLRAQEDADAVTDLQYREDVEKCDYHVPAKLEDPRGILYDFWEGMRTIGLP